MNGMYYSHVSEVANALIRTISRCSRKCEGGFDPSLSCYVGCKYAALMKYYRDRKHPPICFDIQHGVEHTVHVSYLLNKSLLAFERIHAFWIAVLAADF